MYERESKCWMYTVREEGRIKENREGRKGRKGWVGRGYGGGGE